MGALSEDACLLPWRPNRSLWAVLKQVPEAVIPVPSPLRDMTTLQCLTTAVTVKVQ